MEPTELISLLRAAEHDPRAETIFVGIMPGANVKWSLARLASEAADLIEAEMIAPPSSPANDKDR